MLAVRIYIDFVSLTGCKSLDIHKSLALRSPPTNLYSWGYHVGFFQSLQSIPLHPLKSSSAFRKIAMGAWAQAKDPSVYGSVEIDMDKSQRLMDALSKSSGVKIRPVHLVGIAVARAISEMPDINGLIRGKRIHLRREIDVFFQVNIPFTDKEGKTKYNLAGAVVRNAGPMKATELAKILEQRADKIRTQSDEETNRGFDMVKLIPWSFIGVFLNIMSFLIYGLNLNLSWLGIPRDPFGSVMVTNVGSLGIDQAWAPLVPWTRVPLVVTVCAIRERPWAIDGQVVVRPIMNVNITFDHRFMDGVHAAKMRKVFLECFENPDKYFS